MGNATIFLILNSTSPDLQRRRERSARRGPVRCGAIGALVRLGGLEDHPMAHMARRWIKLGQKPVVPWLSSGRSPVIHGKIWENTEDLLRGLEFAVFFQKLVAKWGDPPMGLSCFVNDAMRYSSNLNLPCWTVDGLEHFFPYIGNFIIPTDFHIFRRDRYTTKQFSLLMGKRSSHRQASVVPNSLGRQGSNKKG